MLPPTNRLKHRKDFSAVYRKGMRRNSAHFSLRALRKPKSVEIGKPTAEKSLQPSRTGISISLKVNTKVIIQFKNQSSKTLNMARIKTSVEKVSTAKSKLILHSFGKLGNS